MKTSETETDSEWQKTPYANLVRYKSSGIYFARFRVRGKLIRRSLKTSQISVAKLRLADLEKEESQRAEHQTSVTKGAMEFADALAIYKQRLAGDGSLKLRSKAYREERILPPPNRGEFAHEKISPSVGLCPRSRPPTF
jgi:hypothetical protein